MTDHRWAIVLAAGEGTRIRHLMVDAEGRAIPKQFWPIDGCRTMLDWSLDRGESVACRGQLVIVVADRQRIWWERILSRIPQDNVVVQPENRGTAVGVLLPLLTVFRLDANATTVLLPCDHFVEREDILRSAVESAVSAVDADPTTAVLLGMEAGAHDSEYGWILPDSRQAFPQVARVAAFVEKPEISEAERLRKRGALINSFVLVAKARRLLEFCEESLPDVTRLLSSVDPRPATAAGLRVLAEVYERLPCLDFSRAVVTTHAREFSVLHVPRCGWSDLGTPARLMRFLQPPRTPLPCTSPRRELTSIRP